MSQKKKLNPDHQVEKPYGIPIGNDTQKVGPDDVGKVMVACIDKRLAENLGVTALMFHTIYVDTDGKVYTDAIQKANMFVPPMATALRWSNHDDFMDNTKNLNSLMATKVLDRVRVAVIKGDIPPEKPKKKGQATQNFKIF